MPIFAIYLKYSKHKIIIKYYLKHKILSPVKLIQAYTIRGKSLFKMSTVTEISIIENW